MDTSGSMEGFPIQRSKQVISESLNRLNPGDKFNIITFAGETNVLFEEPVIATQLNLDFAKDFVERRSSGGGTEMMDAIKTAFRPSPVPGHI